MFCTKFHALTKQSQMHPNTMQHTQTWVYGPMEWIGCVHCEKSRHDFVARTFALIAPVHTVFAPSFMQLRNDNRWTQTLRNLPKHEFSVQWGGLGAFVEKNPIVTSWHDFRINCTSSPCFSSSFMWLRNDPKCTLTLCNAPKHEFRVQWGWLVVFVSKNPDVTSWHKLLH